MVVPRLRHVELPQNDKQRWLKLTELYSELNGVQNAKDLAGILQRIFEVAGNDFHELARCGERSKDGSDSCGPGWYFEGLELFLEEIATEEESEIFFKSVLPFIVTLASSIEEFAPSEGILICAKQQESGIVLDRRFIACILASAFLCALPLPPDDVQVRSINFVHLFARFHREDIQHTQAAKLRCLIHYFERLREEWPDIEGRVFYSRQVIQNNSLPTLEDWLSCDLPLCPVIVDNKTSIEDSSEHMLQVDFANRFIGGGVLGAGHVQEEIRFCINPELLVAQLFMEAMQDNESIVIRGVERFSSYSGYGKTFEFVGDFKDESQRDEDGDFHTTVVAIDAKQFKNAPKEAQYEETAVLRELNKALVGFYNPEVGSQLIQSRSDVESDESSVESDDLVASSEDVVVSSQDRVSSSEDLVGSSEETESGVSRSLTQDIKVAKFQEFSDNLVNLAISQALDEIKSNNNYLLEDFVDGDVLANVMKKSLIEVFGSSPEKTRLYSESLLWPSPLPKCVAQSISGSNTPLIPGTPPSSPATFDPEQISFDSDRLRNSLCLDSSPAKGAALSLSMKSFADSLSNSLMSCVERTSSLAAAIATTATSPGQVAAGTKEVFQESPKKLGSPVKNGDSLFSFLTQKSSKPCTPRKSYSNTFNVSEFMNDLSSLVNSVKLERLSAVKDSTDNCIECSNPRKKLLGTFDQIEQEANRKESSEKADEMVFQNFATKLSSSIVDSAIRSSICGTKDKRNAREMDIVDFVSENKSLDCDVDGGSHVDRQSPQSAKQITDNKEFSNILNGHVDVLLVETISSALAEAAEICVGKTIHDLPSSAINDVKEEREEDSGESELSTQSEETESGVDERETSSLESPEDEKSDLHQVSSDVSAEIPQVLFQTAEKISKAIIHDGVTEALEKIKKRSKEATKERERSSREERQHEIDKTTTEESPSFSDEEFIEEQTLNEFAEQLSILTVCGAVKIAEATLEAPSREPRVRPVATGNWGCGVFRGDPELKAVIQWVAASAAGCPVVVYHTFGDRRMSRLLKALVCLYSRGWKVSDVIQGVLRFCNNTKEGREGTSKCHGLLSFLCHTPQTSL